MLPYLLDLAYFVAGCLAFGALIALAVYTCTSRTDDDATPDASETLADFPALPGTPPDAR